MCGDGIIKSLLTTEEQVPISLCGPVTQLSGTILTQYRGTNSRLGSAPRAASRLRAHVYAQGSHIKMFGHLLLNQLLIFHICHAPHILPLPSISFFSFFSFFHQTIFSPHIWSLRTILHSFAFSLDTVFSSVAAFRFELNQINLRADKDAGPAPVRVCWRGRVCALRWPSLARTCPAPSRCYHSHSHDSTVLLAL